MLHSIIFLTSLLFTGAENSQATYKVDESASKIEWTGEKVTGSHNGTVKLKDGSITLEDGKLVGGTFTVDMTTITDLDLEGESKAKLEGHLKSDDFFGVQKFPTAVFVIKEAVPQGPGKYKVIGDVTIKGTTKEIKFNAQVNEKDGTVNASADITLDRAEYDVRYGSGSFFDNLGDKTIYDEFTLNVNLVAKK